jgi:hypothetical protein
MDGGCKKMHHAAASNMLTLHCRSISERAEVDEDGRTRRRAVFGSDLSDDEGDDDDEADEEDAEGESGHAGVDSLDESEEGDEDDHDEVSAQPKTKHSKRRSGPAHTTDGDEAEEPDFAETDSELELDEEDGEMASEESGEESLEDGEEMGADTSQPSEECVCWLDTVSFGIEDHLFFSDQLGWHADILCRTVSIALVSPTLTDLQEQRECGRGRPVWRAAVEREPCLNCSCTLPPPRGQPADARLWRW